LSTSWRPQPRRRSRRPPLSPRALVVLVLAAAVVIAAVVLVARGDRTPRPNHAGVLRATTIAG